jgi:hypothetical protein
MNTVTEILVEVPIETRIRSSDMPEKQQEQFVSMLSYFTEDELKELRGLL